MGEPKTKYFHISIFFTSLSSYFSIQHYSVIVTFLFVYALSYLDFIVMPFILFN